MSHQSLAMAPKHGLGAEETLAKRVKSSETPASRSATPADALAKVAFEVHYPQVPPNPKRKLSKAEEQIVEHAEFQVSPFTGVAKGALKEGELDQHFSITPWKEWNEMKKYNNFISKPWPRLQGIYLILHMGIC